MIKKLTNSDKQELTRIYKDLFCFAGSVFYNVNGIVSDGKFIKDIFMSRKSVDHKTVLRHFSEEGDPDQSKRILLGITPLMKGKEKGKDNNPVFFCQWAAIDVDGGENDSLLKKKEVLERTLKIYRIARNTFNMRCYMEKSRSKGYHLFFFFETPVKPASAKYMLDHICESSGFKNTEVFPKQTSFRDKDNGSQYANAVSLPICGSLYQQGRTVFGDVKNGKFTIAEDQLEFVKSIEKISKEEWITAFSKLPPMPLGKEKLIRIQKKDYQKYSANLDIEKGLSRCEIIRKLSNQDECDDLDYNDFLTALFSFSAFSGIEEHMDRLVANTSKYPNNLSYAKEKLEMIKSSGGRGSNCSYTSCSKKGDITACRFQNISKCLSGEVEEKIPDCPYTPVLAKDLKQVNSILKSIFDSNIEFSDKWEKGIFGKKIIDPLNSSPKEKNEASLDVCRYLFFRGFSEDLVYKCLPYFKFGWYDEGDEDTFWRLVRKASNDNFLSNENRVRKMNKDFREPFNDHVVKQGNKLGIYQVNTKESKTEGEPPQITYKEMTDFFVEKKATISTENEGKRILLDVYPRAFEGRRKFEVMVSMECRSSHTAFSSAISSQLREADVSIYATRDIVQRIMYVAEKNCLSVNAISIESPGYYEDADAYFFRDKIFYGGRVIYLKEKAKMITLGENSYFLNYLNGTQLEMRKTIPNPSCDLREGSVEKSLIVETWKKNAHIMWGGPEDGLHVRMLMGWFSGLAYKKDIMERFFSFPICFIAGNKGSGKNHNLEYFGSLMGFERKWEALGFLNTSTAGLTRMMNDNDVLWVDEFKNGGNAEHFQEIMKSAWTGDKVVKAKLGTQDKVQTYRCNSAMLLTSQAMPDVEAFHERCVMLSIDDVWRSSNEEAANKAKNNMDKIKEQLSEFYSGWILNKTEERKDWLLSLIEKTRDELSSKGFNKRISLNYAVVISCYQLIFHNFDEELFKKDHFKKEMVELGRFMKTLMEEESVELNKKPINDVTDSAIAYFNSSANRHDGKYKDYPVFIERRLKQKDLMYVNVPKLSEWTSKSKKSVNRREHVGVEMHKAQFAKANGFIGKKIFETDFDELRQGVHSFVFEEDCEVFNLLKCIGFCEGFEHGVASYSSLEKEV